MAEVGERVSGLIDRVFEIMREYPIIPVFLVSWLLTQNMFTAIVIGLLVQLLLRWEHASNSFLW